MNRSCPSRRPTGLALSTVSPGQESGFILLSVLFLVAMVILALAVAAPRVADEIRRDRENEFYHRGLQYRQAIRRYYGKFGHYPVSIEQLEKSNEIRFLRQRYKDPFTGKDEWRLIHLGQAKVPPMGFFGQPLTVGVPAAALASTAGNTGGGAVPVDPAAVDSGGGAGTTPDPTAAGSGSPATGGGPIVGVSSTSGKESIRTYRKQAHYNEWEFVYYPAQDQPVLAGSGGNS